MANPNPSPETRFKKNDRRINRKGRPKDFNGMRALAKLIGNEAIDVTTRGGGNVRMSRIEAILRSWAMSKDGKLQKAFVEIAWGKVPDKVELSGEDGKQLVIRVIYDDHDSAS